MSGVEVLQVIRTDLTTRGKGRDGDPIRRVTQYWDMDGNLLAEVDRVRDEDMQVYAVELRAACREAHGALNLLQADPALLRRLEDVLK